MRGKGRGFPRRARHSGRQPSTNLVIVIIGGGAGKESRRVQRKAMPSRDKLILVAPATRENEDGTDGMCLERGSNGRKERIFESF